MTGRVLLILLEVLSYSRRVVSVPYPVRAEGVQHRAKRTAADDGVREVMGLNEPLQRALRHMLPVGEAVRRRVCPRGSLHSVRSEDDPVHRKSKPLAVPHEAIEEQSWHRGCASWRASGGGCG